MTASKEFIGLVKDGNLPLTVSLAISNLVASMEGKRLKIVVSEYARKRSLNQNAYMWSVVIPPITKLFRDAGNDMDDDDVHEFLKEEVGKLKRVIVTPDGEVKRIPGSTKRLTKPEMEDYLHKVRAWAASQGVAIALPNEDLLPPM